ncbi:class I SAM-dependent methyltransferase, partial [bacterium]|nr:class I SAM-dependent methyltransferase [bacterium]
FDTAQRVELCDLTIESENIAHGSPYQPTGVLAFRKAMKGASLPRPAVILDFGCGKGRVLILAAMAGVEKITGIEFSSELCRTARQNLARLQARRPQLKCDCRVVCGDVTGYSYTDDENIFYFFYSFDDCIMKKVITAIEESLKQNPREALIIDFNPFSVLRESTLLKHEKSIDIYGYQCNYYRHIP